MLHPIMPFVTSKIYSSLVSYNDKELMVSCWPKYKETIDFGKEEETIEKIKNIIVEIRNVRAKMNVHPSKKSKLIFVTSDYADMIKESEHFLMKLGFADSIAVQNNKDNISNNAISIMGDNMEVYIPLEELVDLGAEKERLEGEKKKIQSEIDRATKMLNNPGFVSKAPEAKINEEKAKLEKYQEMLKNLEERLKQF